MAPLLVLVVSTLLLALAGRLGVPRLRSAKDVVAIALAIMFLFTAAAHFTATRHDLAAMIPPPLTGQLWIIYLTGILEIAGAIGLLIPSLRRVAAICLALLLVALLPANIHAALAGVELRGSAPTPLIIRVPLQLFWIALLWWSSIHGRRSPRRSAA